MFKRVSIMFLSCLSEVRYCMLSEKISLNIFCFKEPCKQSVFIRTNEINSNH